MINYINSHNQLRVLCTGIIFSALSVTQNIYVEQNRGILSSSSKQTSLKLGFKSKTCNGIQIGARE